jgi:hypothetical protein
MLDLGRAKRGLSVRSSLGKRVPQFAARSQFCHEFANTQANLAVGNLC